MRIRPGWITTDGEFISCPNATDHQFEARLRFPESVNPERTAELSGWIKISGYGDPPYVRAEKEPTQKQIDTMYRMWPEKFGELSVLIFDSIAAIHE